VEYGKNVKPSSLGEKEISSINQIYLDAGNLEVGLMMRGMSWFDAGTVESLDDASKFIRIIQNHQSAMIGYIEEVEYKRRFTDKSQLGNLSARYGKPKYGDFLNDLNYNF